MFKLNWYSAMVLVFVACTCSFAAPLSVVTYSMPNGQTGGYNYRDFTYAPCPGNACNTSFASLSGGTGKLTDGVSPSTSWSATGTATPWVGWSSDLPDPIVTFDFGKTVNVDSMTIWVDNTPGSGDVRAPSQVSVDGDNFAIPADPNWGPRAYTFSGLDLIGSSVSVQFFQVPDKWIMVGEVSFASSNTSAVPELATSLLVAGGLLLAGLLRIGGHSKPKRSL